MNKQEAIQLVETTIRKSYEIFSEDTEWQPIISTREQLNYVLEGLNKNNDRDRLKDIIIGIYAVREFETNHEDFANLLYEVVEIVSLMKKNKI